MRCSALSFNEFAHFHPQCQAGELHPGINGSDWAELLRSLLDVPIALVGVIDPAGVDGPGLPTHAGDSRPERCSAGLTHGGGLEAAGIPGTGGRNSPAELVRMLGGVMQRDGMTIIPDLRASDTRSEILSRASAWGVRSLAGFLFPGDAGGGSIIVCVMDRQRRGYTVGELEILQRVAEIARASRSLAGALEGVKRILGESPAASAKQASSALQELISDEPANTVQHVAEAMAVHLEACALEIHERAGHRGMLRLSAAWGQPGHLLGRRTARMGSRCQADTAMKTGRPVMSEDLGTECGYRTAALLRRIGVGRGISVPIGDTGEPMGVISVYWSLPGAIPAPVAGLVRSVAGCLGEYAARRRAQDALCGRLGDPAWVSRNLGRHLQTAAIGCDGRIVAASGLFLGGATEPACLPDTWSGVKGAPVPLQAGSLLGPRTLIRDILKGDHVVRTPSGDEAWYRLIRVSVPAGSECGRRAMVLQTDITDQVRADRLLDAPELLFSGSGVCSRPDAAAVVDGSGTILQATGEWPGIVRPPTGGISCIGLDPIFPTECDCGRETCTRARAELTRAIRKAASGAHGGLRLEFLCGPPERTRCILSRVERIPDAGRNWIAVGLWDLTSSRLEDGERAVSQDGAGVSPVAENGRRRKEGGGIDERQIEETIAHLSYHDGITGLPNHTLLRDRLDLAVLRARRSGMQFGLLVLDLDRFKVLNDSLGRQAGDHLLRLVGQRLVQAIRAGDTVARLGGDEFLILLPEIGRAEDAERAACQILDVMKKPFRLGGRDVFVTCSIGISLYPASGDDAEALIKDADIAMYRAKAVGGDCHELFSPSMTVKAYERFGLEADLHQAIRQKEFEVFYQPLFDLDSGIIHGAEALVRWRHPARGLMLPDSFISVAEETGLIVPIGHDVLRRSFHDIRGLQQRGHPGLRLSVNISLRQFHQPDLVSQVEEVLHDTGMNPDEVSLEITESVAMCPMVSCVNTLHGLKTLGLRMSLDDFGQGHSSLTRLKRLPIDSIKIDRAFVRRLTLDQRDAAIARAMITMAHSLDLDVTAEGVEEPAQLEFLRREGCDAVQGFLLSRPVPLADLETMLREGRRIGEAVRPGAPHA